MTLRLRLAHKFIALLVVILTTALSYHAYTVVIAQTQVMAAHLEEKGEMLGRFIALISIEPILAYDFASLDGFAREAGKDADVAFAAVLDTQGVPITSHFDPHHPAIAALSPPQTEVAGIRQALAQSPGVILREFPIELDRRSLGRVVVGLSDARLQMAKAQLQQDLLLGYAVILGVLCAAVILVFRWSVLEPVNRMLFAAAGVAQGCYDRPVEIASHDEMGLLARAFNRMLWEIQAERRKLLKLSLAVEQSPTAVLITDPEAKIEYCNPSFERLSGWTLGEIKGQNPRLLKSGHTPEEAYRELWQRLMAGESWTGQFHNRRRDGAFYWANTNIVPIHDADGTTIHLLALIQDVTERREWEARLYQQANFDSLTGLANRNRVLETLQGRIDAAVAKGDASLIALLFLDLDNFKSINDTLGHATGDLLLQAVAERLGALMPAGATLARLGGDEFLVLHPDLNRCDEADALAQRVIAATSEPFHLQGRELFIGASVGITFFPTDGNDPFQLLRNADAAMYRAKESGRKTWFHFTDELNRRLQRRLALENQLRQALDRKEFQVYYQPLWDAGAGRIAGAEALLRWQSRQLGFLPPGEFIDIAEDTGLILEIGAWVLREACRQMKRWHDAGFPDLVLSVNVSTTQFSHSDLVGVVTDALTQSRLDGIWLKLEITESLLLEDRQEVVRRMHQLKAMGVHMAIDDFGTGYSCLSYLRELPLDVLKIDRSFVEDLGHQGGGVMVSTIVAMAKNLGLKVIAEGVETDAQLHFLHERGVDLIQGYHISAPLPADEFERLLANPPPFPSLGAPRVGG